eukprot:gene7455-13221_t
MSSTIINFGIVLAVLYSVAVESMEKYRESSSMNKSTNEEESEEDFQLQKRSISSLHFPSTYHASGNIRIPSAGIVEPFEAWYAGKFNKSRIDYYEGTVKTFQRGDVGKYGTLYEVIPKYDYRHKSHYQGCWKKNGKEKKRIEPQSVLPKTVYWPFRMNLTQYEFQGFVKLNGIWCSKWIAVLEAFNRTDTYIFHATDEDNPKPMRFEMNGYDVMLTSYYDHYIVDYKVFESWTYDAEMFMIPQVAKRDRWCQKVPKNVGEAGYRSINPIGEFLDDEEYGKFETKFKHFKSNFGKVYKHEEEHRKRMHIARHNMRYIHSMNRRRLGYDLDVNHFVDMTDEEYNNHRGTSYDTQKETEKYEKDIPILGEDFDPLEVAGLARRKAGPGQSRTQILGKRSNIYGSGMTKIGNFVRGMQKKDFQDGINGKTSKKTSVDDTIQGSRVLEDRSANNNQDIEKDLRDLKFFIKQLDDISDEIRIDPEKSRRQFQTFIQNPSLIQKELQVKYIDRVVRLDKTARKNNTIVLERNDKGRHDKLQKIKDKNERKEVLKGTDSERKRKRIFKNKTNVSDYVKEMAIKNGVAKKTKSKEIKHYARKWNRKLKKVSKAQQPHGRSKLHEIKWDEMVRILDDEATEDKLRRSYKSNEIYEPEIKRRKIQTEVLSSLDPFATDRNEELTKKGKVSSNGYYNFMKNWETPAMSRMTPFFALGVEEMDPETGEMDVTETDFVMEDHSRFPKEYYAGIGGEKLNRGHKVKSKKKKKKKKKKTRIPEELDWSKYGAVPPVQSQGICGSCWTFSTAAAVESSHFIKTGELIKLSEQQLLDCTWYVPHSKEGNHGCMGGWTWKSFAYIKDFGLATSKSYGNYLGMESSCKTKNYTVGAKIDSFMKVQANSASALMKAIAHYGPATASINTEAKTLKFYKSGVYDDKICSEYDFN